MILCISYIIHITQKDKKDENENMNLEKEQTWSAEFELKGDEAKGGKSSTITGHNKAKGGENNHGVDNNSGPTATGPEHQWKVYSREKLQQKGK